MILSHYSTDFEPIVLLHRLKFFLLKFGWALSKRTVCIALFFFSLVNCVSLSLKSIHCSVSLPTSDYEDVYWGGREGTPR